MFLTRELEILMELFASGKQWEGLSPGRKDQGRHCPTGRERPSLWWFILAGAGLADMEFLSSGAVASPEAYTFSDICFMSEDPDRCFPVFERSPAKVPEPKPVFCRLTIS